MERYAKALDYFARSYAKLAALLEEEYIFNWLSWDGDNMLASGAILDYGSIRQFAKARQVSLQRRRSLFGFTCEQRGWARTLVQVFAQAMGFILSGTKRISTRLRMRIVYACLMMHSQWNEISACSGGSVSLPNRSRT